MPMNQEDILTVENEIDTQSTASSAAEPNKFKWKIAQVNVLARDFSKLREFYSQALGIQGEETRSSEDRTSRACRFDLESSSLMLIEWRPESSGAEMRAHGAETLVFSVGSNEAVDMVFDHIRQLPGCKVAQLPHYAFDNRYETILEDPEGNTLIFRD